ncbi:MAG: hypothetical protein OEY51_08335, partial [Cyclobacteriaceae bacterium]|nr:hypothetical protein [Cyclobacteriaceae bacterium]
VIFDNSLKSELFKRCSNSSNSEVYFHELYKTGSGQKSIGRIDSYGRVVLNYGDDEYYPVLYVPNIESADLTLEPIIALGADIDVENEEDYDGGDIIFGYFYNENDEYVEVFLDETMAFKETRPIIVVTYNNQEVVTKPKDEKVVSNGRSEITWYYGPMFKLVEYSISQRYDGTNNSEYSVIVIPRSPTLTPGVYANYPNERQKVREIHKSDVGSPGTTFIHNYSMTPVSLYANMDRYFLVTFEYDWFASEKTISWSSASTPDSVVNSYAYKGAKMSNEDEWYQITHFDPNSSFTHTIYSKGHLKISVP